MQIFVTYLDMLPQICIHYPHFEAKKFMAWITRPREIIWRYDQKIYGAYALMRA